MSLAAADFQGFDANAAVVALRAFDGKATKRGIEYYNIGAVRSVVCVEPGAGFVARVRGGGMYEVSVNYDGKTRQWLNFCTCPIGWGCKHAYAALKYLLAEHSNASVRALSSSSPKKSLPVIPRPVVPTPAPVGFAALAEAKLARRLAKDEAAFVGKIRQLHEQARLSRGLFINDLSALGVKVTGGWWDKLDLWPSFPQTETEFWNYLALYLEEHQGIAVPDFLQPITKLDSVRERMRHHQRAREVERWKTTLAHLGEATVESAATEPVELRLRFTPTEAIFDWRLTDRDWVELKQRKQLDFDATHARRLGPEAALLWQPVALRAHTFYAASLLYGDTWAREQIGRWLRQPSLHSLLVNAAGEPLNFIEAPLRWDVTPPQDESGDYTLRLVQAGGEPLPAVWVATSGSPAHYLTPLGVFTGPPQEEHLLSLHEPTHIPAQALESQGGLRLLDRIRAEPPPRLAARVRVVTLRPRLVAEIKNRWAGSDTEYCHLDVLGASEDGRHVERWNGERWSRADEFDTRKNRRDEELERLDRSALSVVTPPIAVSGFKFDHQFGRWSQRLTKKFPEAFVPFLKSLPPGTVIELRGELASFQNAEVAGKIRLEASEAGMDWFDLRVLVDVNDATLTPEEIKLLLDAKGKWVRLGTKGWRKLEFALSEEEDKELARLGLTPHELTSEPQRLHALQLADKAARKFLPEDTCDRIERRAADLQARVTPEVPAAITAEMRPYQRDGFHFLAYLSTNNFGGILADDMGLGKTVQTLAWLAWLRDGGLERGVHAASTTESLAAPGSAEAQDTATLKRTEVRAPSLVVCPKSVADNWRAEVEKFLPSLKVRVWPARDLKSFAGQLASADLHVLNYSQLRLVSDDLARATFHAVILDEGQYIKNPSSLTAQVARQLRSTHRLILSGTPIENRLLDLWSLMSFAMPGALGSRAAFARLYDAKNDPFARQRLSARVRPFLIRRTKAQVARDLPDRVEEDLYCELEGEQKLLYRAELKRAQAMLLGVKTAAALNQQRFNFLTSLLRLRQICCHPRLVKTDSKAASAKVEALFETLEPLMEEGQKVLVFSQFVELLDILRDELETRGWQHWYLAGSTENRGDLVREFQAAEGAGVFLISLKAGGFGLNLTASSYVVLFDPWWNPAVESQAIDRTHRIGQARKVIAYRLLIKDSIEEKIRALQKQKKSLAEDVLGEEKFSQGLSLDDLRYLLA